MLIVAIYHFGVADELGAPIELMLWGMPNLGCMSHHRIDLTADIKRCSEFGLNYHIKDSSLKFG